MMLRGTQINYMPDKSHLIISIINAQGQVVVKVRVLTRKKLTFHFEIKSPTRQNYKLSENDQVQIRASFGIEMVSSGILRFPLTKRSCSTSLQPIRIRAANAFEALAFLVWPARRRVLQRACSLSFGRTY